VNSAAVVKVDIFIILKTANDTDQDMVIDKERKEREESSRAERAEQNWPLEAFLALSQC